MADGTGRVQLLHDHLLTGHKQFSLNSGNLQQPMDQFIPAAAQAGFGGIELWSRDFDEGTSLEQVRDTLEANGIEVSAFQLLRDFEGCQPAKRAGRLAEAERLMEQMARLGADLLLVCANTTDDCAGDQGDIARDLRCLADMAKARNLRITFEPLAWSRWLNTYEAAAECIEYVDHPALGLTIDMFHWFWSRTPIEFFSRLPMARCFQVQVCDAVPAGLSAIDTARHHRLFPGEGVWPVAELMRKFRNAGFDGYYNIEVFNDSYRKLPTAEFVSRAVASVNYLLAD